MVARLLGNDFVTGRAIYIFTLERQGSSSEECGLRCQLLSAFGFAGTLQREGTGTVKQSRGTTPTCQPGARFARGIHRYVWLGWWKVALGMLQTSKSGLENVQRSFLSRSSNPARSLRWDAEDQGMGSSLEPPH